MANTFVGWVAVANCPAPALSLLRKESYKSIHYGDAIFFQAEKGKWNELMALAEASSNREALVYFRQESIFNLSHPFVKGYLETLQGSQAGRHTLPQEEGLQTCLGLIGQLISEFRGY